MKLVLAYASIYLIWGSTYYAIAVGIETMSPALMLGLRFLIGAGLNGALALGWERSRGFGAFPQIRNAVFVGVLLLIGGTGLVGYAEQTIPSHLAAVIIASMPLWIGLWERALAGPEDAKVSLTRSRVLGIGLGVAGIALLVGGNRLGASAHAADPAGLAFLAAAIACWSFGSAYSHVKPMPAAPFGSAAIQMATAGIVLLGWAWGSGEGSWEMLREASSRSWWAVGYLAVFGSTVAFTAFAWLMRVEPPTRVASYALVNPAVAVAIGIGLGREAVTPATWAGLACVLAGLWLHMRR